MNDSLEYAIDNLDNLIDDERLSPALRRKLATIRRQVRNGLRLAENEISDLRELLNRNPDFCGDIMGRPADDFSE